MDRYEHISKNLNTVLPKIKNACLVAVSKYYPVSDIVHAYHAGQRNFGESRVQELVKKSNDILLEGINDIVWHFIGHLQTNKINQLLKVKGLAYIHSIDSFKLLGELYKRENHLSNQKLNFFLQVKTSDEDEKYGMSTYQEIASAVDFITKNKFKKLEFAGLMTMGKIRTDNFVEEARKCFKKLAMIKDKLEEEFALDNLKLSMGMSDDYHVAMEERTDFVRIGSSIFG